MHILQLYIHELGHSEVKSPPRTLSHAFLPASEGKSLPNLEDKVTDNNSPPSDNASLSASEGHSPTRVLSDTSLPAKECKSPPHCFPIDTLLAKETHGG